VVFGVSGGWILFSVFWENWALFLLIIFGGGGGP